MASSKPIEEHDSLINYDQDNKPIRPKRQLPDEVNVNKQFFDDIFRASRKSRDTSDDDVAPTIALSDLISAVEHTLIHSAQNLAASNATGNLTTRTTEPNKNNISNVSNIQHIVLPITIPTPEPKPIEIVTESVDVTTISEEDLIRENRSDEESVSEQSKTEFESVKPIEKSNLGILFPISLNPSANISHAIVADEQHKDPPVTEATIQANPSNITILHTINSTQVIPNESDEGVHLHQQHITIFSANDGVLPNIHAFLAQDLPAYAQHASSPQPDEEEDCSGEEPSAEFENSTSSSEEDSSSESSSEEKEEVKKNECKHKSSVAVSKIVEATTPSEEAVKKMKTDELKVQIAEVEADPVILTQGI